MNATLTSTQLPWRTQRGMLLLLHVAVALPMLCGAGIGRVNAQTAISREVQLKAAFLYNIAKFVEWPTETFTDMNAPIVIGVLGDNSFGDELATFVKDRRINGRAIIVSQVDTLEAARMTHLLFFDARAHSNFVAMETALQQNSVLTVGENQEFEDGGGMIRFVPVDDKLRFEINMASAERAGLKLSAQLQKLATRVRRNR